MNLLSRIYLGKEPINYQDYGYGYDTNSDNDDVTDDETKMFFLKETSMQS